MKSNLIVVGGILLCASAVLAETPAPAFVGTWKLDVAKSKYSPGPPPKSIVTRNEAVEGALHHVTDGTDSKGKPFHEEFTAKFDGKDYPVKGSEPGETISLTKIDDYTTAWTVKVNGRVAATGQTVYSRDGKLRTTTASGTTEKGDKFSNMTVFERQ